MKDFKAHVMEFTCETLTQLTLPGYNGSNLRGGFFGALRRDFCLNKDFSTCLECPTAGVCPICLLVATVERNNQRGAEVPRPFALKPVIGVKTDFAPGEQFTFGMTFFGDTLNLFPYAILAVQRMGEMGIGLRRMSPGRFILISARAVNPVTGEEMTVYSNATRIVNMPDLPITDGDIRSYAAKLGPDKVRIDLITPLRLVVDGSLVQKLSFPNLLRRLLRRLTDLYECYVKKKLELDFPVLLKMAEEVKVKQDETRWIDLSSYSNRRKASTPVGGLVGSITFEGNMREFLSLLAWGQITHVGKDATRGNGWYRITDSSS